MGKTKIEWTDYTFNPWWGCTRVSPGCDHCYAETWAKRCGLTVWGKDAERRFFGDKYWNEPLKWDWDAQVAGVRRRVFCGSMCDVMEDRPELVLGNADLHACRARLFDLIERTANLDWLLLTKRPQNFQRFLPAAWLKNPRPNVWGMTTVESSEYLWRVEKLLATPFHVRGLSLEPLLGPVDISSASDWGVDWVIVGGESGPGARPMHPDWVRSTRDQCVAAGAPFFFKQWGEWSDIQDHFFGEDALDGRVHHWDPRQAGVSGGGTGVSIRRGKTKNGRLLDGRTWDEFPEVRR